MWSATPTLWREDYGHRIRFPATPQGLAQAQAALAHFAETGELPPPQPGPPLRDDLPYFELGTRGFVIDLTNAAGQTHFDISFTLAAESDTVQRIDQVHWTNHPEWVTGARLEAETDPLTGETLTSYRLTLDRGV